MGTEDIAWLAGFLEGEGCFANFNRIPQIIVETTDRDVIERAAHLMSVRRVVHYPKKREHWKATWRAAKYGKDALVLMFSIFPLLGERRRSKIERILTEFEHVQ